MKYIIDGSDIVLTQTDFNLDETLDCGQAFRWEKINENSYRGFRLNSELIISDEGNNRFRFHNASESDFIGVWADYFDLGTDYSEIKQRISSDSTMKAACGFAGGIRLLRQDSWEALCSFIISQNNNIPRIKGIISRLCEHYGGFPTYEQLSRETPESLQFLRAGFRGKYLVDAAQKLSDGRVQLERLKNAGLDEARKELMTINGVGPKVAECALLYGMYRTQAFPVDVWIKRVMAQWYPDGLPECCKGIEGIAQQYLFHYIRCGVTDGAKTT